MAIERADLKKAIENSQNNGWFGSYSLRPGADLNNNIIMKKVREVFSNLLSEVRTWSRGASLVIPVAFPIFFPIAVIAGSFVAGGMCLSASSIFIRVAGLALTAFGVVATLGAIAVCKIWTDVTLS